MLDKDSIVQTLQLQTDLLRQKYHVQKMGLIGSFSRGQQTAKSDIDFIIELDATTSNIFETKAKLRKYLKQIFHRNIDLAHYQYLKPFAKETILKDVQPIV